MKLSLFHKFSISILSICVLGMALVWISTRLLFESSFLDYINTQNERPMRQAVVRLSEHYLENDGWEALNENNRLWRQLASGISEPAFDDFRPLPRRDSRKERRNEPPGLLRPRSGDALPPHVRGERRPPSTNRKPIDLTLIDSNEIFIAGHRRLMENPNLIRLPIEADGQVVGYLLGTKQTQITESVDRNFAESLNHSVLIVLGFSLAFTLVIATFLARNMSRPIKNLSKAAHDLSQGNYEARIPTDRSDEIGQLAEDFNLLAKTLENNRHSQQRWIADISHELRTPLAVLKGELMAIQDGVRQFDDASLNSLISETDRFSRMVNDLYDLSRADAGDLDYRMSSLDVRFSLEDCLEHHQHRFAEKDIQLSLELSHEEVVVNADPGRMTQLLSNLLENSLRYTNSGGQTHISCSTDSKNAVIVIEDTAPGVPMSSLNRIFERLYRVEGSRSRQYGGGGLGLALCKTIAEAHQGSIFAENSHLGGLKIKVVLPLANS